MFELFALRKKNNAAKNRYLLSCFLLLAGGGAATKSHAVASPDDTFKPYVSSTLLYDSNFLRQSDNGTPIPGQSDKSDFIKQAKAGFDMDWIIGRQHVVVKANVNQNWFQNFSTLDYTGWDTQAQWNWHLGNNLDGQIGYNNAQTLSTFGQLNSLIGNLVNSQRAFAEGGYLFHPNGKIKLGWFRTENQFDSAAREASNNIENNAELNLQYLSPTGSIWGLRVLGTDGQYPQRQITPGSTLDTAYTRMNYSVTGDWHANGKTRVDGLVGYTQQFYEHYNFRDFDDITAQINLHWQASEKTLLELSGRRLINQSDTLFSSFYLTQGVWFNLNWKATPKITLDVPMSYQEQQYDLGGSNTGIAGFDQTKDKVSNVGLNLLYYPVQSISIGPVLNYEKRDSNNVLRSYETKSAGVNLQAAF
ncbi:MAG: outer membrane beta-barrel protein [Methylobacter sp.]|nr:outer membrane beta-barrel protein [Methylobacter sp.]